MTNTNESFIDEVTEAVRRERLNLWLRRWGWLIGLAVVLIVGGAAWYEWRQSQAEAAAELRGEALLTALETPDDAARLAALSELPVAGGEGVVAGLLLAAEQQAAGDAQAAIATLEAIATDGDVAPLYRDLAAFKAQLVRGPEADPAALEALAAPGAPFRLLALEQLAAVELAAGNTEAAIQRLQAIREDADLGPSQGARVDQLLIALGAPPEEEAPAESVVPPPAVE